jgi:hypothetical protein
VFERWIGKKGCIVAGRNGGDGRDDTKTEERGGYWLLI